MDKWNEVTASAFRPRDTALLVTLALVWGNSFLFIKTAVTQVPPTWVVAVRMSIGALLLFALGLAKGQRQPWDKKAVLQVGFIGVAGSAVPWVVQAWAQQFLNSGLVAVLNACTPLVTLLLAVAVGQERLYRNRVLGLFLAVCGTLTVVWGEVQAGRSALALAMAVLATFGYAVAAVMTRAYVSGRVPNLFAATVQLSAGAIVLIPTASVLSGPPPTQVTPAVALALLALGVLGTGLAFLMYFALIQSVGATNTSLVTYIVPVVGLTSGALVRGERFGLNVFLGAAAMISGVWLAQRAPAGTRPVPLPAVDSAPEPAQDA